MKDKNNKNLEILMETANKRAKELREADETQTTPEGYKTDERGIIWAIIGGTLMLLGLMFLAFQSFSQSSPSSEAGSILDTEQVEVRYTGFIMNVWALQINDAEYDWMKEQPYSKCELRQAKAGDTWESIAKELGVKYQLLKMLNYLPYPPEGEMPEIKEGQQYRIFQTWANNIK